MGEIANEEYMRGVSPRILDTGRRILKYLGRTGDKTMLRSVVIWLRKHQMQRTVRWVVEDDESDPNLLLGYILNDAPLPKLSALMAAHQ